MSPSAPRPGRQGSAADREALTRAVDKADLRILLMVLFHLTGDRHWLSYRPVRDVKLIADEDAGLSNTEQAQIRTAAVEVLSGPATPAVADPGDSLMTEMMQICLGEKVPAEYAHLMREEMGFISRDYAWKQAGAPRAGAHKVAIIGAGVSGIALAARLKRLGIEHVVLERHEDVGGVWLENRYPGAGVDTPNHAYSYSFAQPHPWPRFFSSREEIHQYLRKTAEAFGIMPSIRFSTRVSAADWDEAGRCWTLRLATPNGDDTLQASVLVSAIGQFGEPLTPNIRGTDHFQGPIFHSADWPEGFDVAGKHVAIIGTGASAMQIVPTVVDEVASLTIYQRTPQWARPVARYHDQIDEGVQWLLQHVPFYAGWFRFTMWWRYGDGLLQQLRRDPKWAHKDRSINRRNERHREELTAHIVASLAGRPDLVARAVPDYPPFAKRILLDNGWYQAIAKPQVELVAEGVSAITEQGVLAEDGVQRPADTIIFATGFRLGQLAARLNVSGRGGLRLADAWANDNPTAYLGITVPGFPNFFMMQGPNTGLAHGGSAIFQAESQARYISGMVVEMAEQGIETCEVSQTAHDEFVARVDAAHAQLIWTHPGVSNYYKNSSGRIFSAMPFRLVDYWRMTHEPDLSPYEVRMAIERPPGPNQ